MEVNVCVLWCGVYAVLLGEICVNDNFTRELKMSGEW